ncbi:HIT-type Zinc finger family protein [Artemisia annua]|uniref:HIT-type Zinc finger family protein n=1 Tax=Artemisia annua TaxID=35608 RepID=A0A2U1QCN0_ARTAN|nr:HIT-type Zinc finger family protein [Artemisia annua]
MVKASDLNIDMDADLGEKSADLLKNVTVRKHKNSRPKGVTRVVTQSTLDSSSPPVQVDGNISEGYVEPVPHVANPNEDIDEFTLNYEVGKYPVWAELDSNARTMVTDAIQDLCNAFVADIKAKSTTPKPSNESPIVQAVDINTNVTSSVGATGLRDAQPFIDTSFRTLVAEPVLESVNISIPRKVVEKGKHGLKRIMMNSEGFFFFKFHTLAGLEAFLEGGPWMIRKSPIILKKWSMDTCLLKEELTRIPVWVKLHDVPLQVFEEDGISLIATFIGNPIMLDSYTSSMCKDSWGRSSFARCLIEINSEVDLVDVFTIRFPSLSGEGFTKATISVEYEWRPPRCNGNTSMVNASNSSSMLKSTGTTSKEDDEDLVENVHDESANLFNNPHTGETTSFTVAADRWIGDSRLCDRFPRLFHLDRRPEGRVADKGRWVEGVWTWEWEWFREPRGRVSRELELEGLMGTYGGGSLMKMGGFTVKELTKMVEERILDVENAGEETIWLKLVPKKVNIFVWRALKRRLPVREELDKRGIDLDTVLCPCCNSVVESCEHSLVMCSMAMGVWEKEIKKESYRLADVATRSWKCCQKSDFVVIVSRRLGFMDAQLMLWSCKVAEKWSTLCMFGTSEWRCKVAVKWSALCMFGTIDRRSKWSCKDAGKWIAFWLFRTASIVFLYGASAFSFWIAYGLYWSMFLISVLLYFMWTYGFVGSENTMADSIIVSETSSNSSHLNPPSRTICRVCQKQFSQYTCPRCNTRYCSLPCYKSHSLRCTESFMRDNVMGEMQQMEPGDETKQKMLDILKRFHSDEEADSMDNDDGLVESALSEETIQKIMSGVQISFDDLSTEEKKHFQRTVASGELSKLIEPWEPWWLKPSARTISLSPEGTQRVQPITNEEADPLNKTYEVPPGPETALPPISKLTSTEPSPLLAIHLVDILYSYCFTLRLYNGDWESDPVGSTTVVLSISSVLGQNGQPETVSEALSYCLEQTCSPAFRHMGGSQFGLGILDDVVSLLSLGGDGLVCGLCDLHRMLKAGMKEVKMEKTHKEIKGKLKSGERKVYFLMCWVHEQPQEAWSSLAGLVTVEKNAAMDYKGNGTRDWRAERKTERKGKVIIEEVL